MRYGGAIFQVSGGLFRHQKVIKVQVTAAIIQSIKDPILNLSKHWSNSLAVGWLRSGCLAEGSSVRDRRAPTSRLSLFHWAIAFNFSLVDVRSRIDKS